ncbi:MAG: UTP--glucose-1-phosphate uridylyltransferase GalU [Gammaproteobacteria bacterium]|nr:UTP--glucose-1-phosphate uridylyltransferase GalU [Gammaproteobacteria bacterium]
MKKIRKAVFPVAGLGTRFLPATKASPKEMLPVVDKPLIQYAVEEAVEAGIEQLIFVTGRNKRSIPDHFDKAYELESELEAKGKDKLLKLVKDIVPPHISCIYLRQSEALGLGHAVLCAKPVVGNEPFSVILADDLIDNESDSCVKQMVDSYAKHESSILAVQQVEKDETDKYGIVSLENKTDNEGFISGIVEKPAPADAPSTLAVVGRYILNPRIFHFLEKTQKGAGGEIQLTDAISDLLSNEKVYAYEFDGIRYDCGSKLGYLQANVELGMKHPEIGAEFTEYLSNLIK